MPDATLVASDLMLREPKTLAADASVPAEAVPTEAALSYADESAETISRGAPARDAFQRGAASPTRRLVVLDDDANLLGLLCLNPSRTGFWQTPTRAES